MVILPPSTQYYCHRHPTPAIIAGHGQEIGIFLPRKIFRLTWCSCRIFLTISGVLESSRHSQKSLPEWWGDVSFSEHRIVGQQGERYPENKAQGAEFFGEIWIFLLHPFVDQPGLGLGLVTMAWDDCAMVTNPTTPQINTAGRAPGLGRCGACLILV